MVKLGFNYGCEQEQLNLDSQRRPSGAPAEAIRCHQLQSPLSSFELRS